MDFDALRAVAIACADVTQKEPIQSARAVLAGHLEHGFMGVYDPPDLTPYIIAAANSRRHNKRVMFVLLKVVVLWLSPSRKRATQGAFHPKRMKANGVFEQTP